MRNIRTKEVICLKGTWFKDTFTSDDKRQFKLLNQFMCSPVYGYFELHHFHEDWYKIPRKIILESS